MSHKKEDWDLTGLERICCVCGQRKGKHSAGTSACPTRAGDEQPKDTYGWHLHNRFTEVREKPVMEPKGLK